MKEKCRYPCWYLKHKGKEYKVIVFPDMDAVMYDSYPTESTYDIDCTSNAARELAKIMAIMIRDPGAIVYLPIKKNRRWATYNVVYSRHSIDGFKPSIWYKIKSGLRSPSKHCYKFDYDSQKLIEYKMKNSVGVFRRCDYVKSMLLFVQKELGDTIFCQYGLDEYYDFHSGLVSAAEDIENGAEKLFSGWGLGFVLSSEMWRWCDESGNN